MSEPKRLHPIAILFNIFKTIKELIVPIVFFTVLPGRDIGLPEYIRWLIFGGICLIVIALAVISWLRFTYRVEDGELKIESGVFVRKNRYIRFERIHSVDLSEGIIQRLFGLVKVNIETAGGAQSEAVLSAIHKDEAEQLNGYLLEAKKSKSIMEQESNENQVDDEISHIMYRQSFLELFLMSATSGAVGVVLSGMAAFLSQFDEMIPYERLFGQSKEMLELGTVLLVSLVIAGIFLIYVAAVLIMMLKYAHFTVENKDGELVISRGLLEKRQLTIPLGKIQGIRIIENVVRQPLGYATVCLEYAGGSLKEKESLTVMLFPLIKKNRIQERLELLIPNYQSNLSLIPLPIKAYPRYAFRQCIFYIPIVIACIYFLNPWGYASLLLLPMGFGWAYLQYKAAGWNINDSQLTIRSRFLSKQTLLMHKNKIQSIESSTSWVQNKKQLTTVSALVKSGITYREGKVRDVDVKDFPKIQAWFLTKKE